jgi:hypothetical protein
MTRVPDPPGELKASDGRGSDVTILPRTTTGRLRRAVRKCQDVAVQETAAVVSLHGAPGSVEAFLHAPQTIREPARRNDPPELGSMPRSAVIGSHQGIGCRQGAVRQRIAGGQGLLRPKQPRNRGLVITAPLDLDLALATNAARDGIADAELASDHGRVRLALVEPCSLVGDHPQLAAPGQSACELVGELVRNPLVNAATVVRRRERQYEKRHDGSGVGPAGGAE